MAGAFTYCSGPTYKLEHHLTQSDVIVVLDALHEIFGHGWKFELEAITEGGIQVTQWPGKELRSFKTFRLGAPEWPWITPTSAQEWRDSEEQVYEGKVLRTYLKAFFEAPCWSVQELEKWNRAWARVGAQVVKKSLYPKHKYTSSRDATTKPVRKRFRE